MFGAVFKIKKEDYMREDYEPVRDMQNLRGDISGHLKQLNERQLRFIWCIIEIYIKKSP